MSTEAMGEVAKTVKWHSSPSILSLAFLQPNMYVQASEQMCKSVFFCASIVVSVTPSPFPLKLPPYACWEPYASPPGLQLHEAI